MIPITRKDHYLNEIVGWGDTAPEKPYIEEEFFFAAILGEAVQTPEPLSRYQIYLAKIAGRNISVPKPLTRLELFLAKACGMDIETPTPITREEMFWADYAAIVEFEVEGVPPLTYKAVEGKLENYRIYGNTVGGESVGDRTGNLFDKDDPDILDGYEIRETNIVARQLYFVTNFISVNAETSYITNDVAISGFSSGVLEYDSSKQLIRRNPNSSYNGFTTTNTTAYIKLNGKIENKDTCMFVKGNTVPSIYEPYGYKVPVAVSNGTDTLTTPIYLPEQIRKVGDEAEYISYSDQKMHRIGEEDIDVVLPELPTLAGTNTLSVGTAVQPSKVYVKYKGERQ